MGRKKIKIEPIQEGRNRQVTYLKRKAGLFKKAYELATLTDSQVAVIVFGHNGRLSQFCSGDMDEVLLRYTEFEGNAETKGSEDFAGREGDEEEDDEDDEAGGAGTGTGGPSGGLGGGGGGVGGGGDAGPSGSGTTRGAKRKGGRTGSGGGNGNGNGNGSGNGSGSGTGSSRRSSGYGNGNTDGIKGEPSESSARSSTHTAGPSRSSSSSRHSASYPEERKWAIGNAHSAASAAIMQAEHPAELPRSPQRQPLLDSDDVPALEANGLDGASSTSSSACASPDLSSDVEVSSSVLARSTAALTTAPSTAGTSSDLPSKPHTHPLLPSSLPPLPMLSDPRGRGCDSGPTWTPTGDDDDDEDDLDSRPKKQQRRFSPSPHQPQQQTGVV